MKSANYDEKVPNMNLVWDNCSVSVLPRRYNVNRRLLHRSITFRFQLLWHFYAYFIQFNEAPAIIGMICYLTDQSYCK